MTKFGQQKRDPRDAQYDVEWIEEGFPPSKPFRWMIFLTILTVTLVCIFLYYQLTIEAVSALIIVPLALILLRRNRLKWLKKTGRWKKEWDD